MKQWIEYIKKFVPNARIGKIQGNIIDIEDKDIILGMLESIAMRDYSTEIFKDIKFTCVDEVHRIGCEVFSRALFKINSEFMLGLSATVERKDGLTKIFKWSFGEVIYSVKREDKGLIPLVRIYKYY